MFSKSMTDWEKVGLSALRIQICDQILIAIYSLYLTNNEI